MDWSGLGKALMAGGTALNSQINKPVNYYVDANWKGNGLANTGIQSYKNQNYINPYDANNALAGLIGGGSSDAGQTGGGFSFDFFKPSGDFSQSMFNNLKLKDILSKALGRNNRFIGTGDFYSNTSDIA